MGSPGLSELLECHLTWICPVSGILTTSPAARMTCWTCKQGFTLPLQKNTSLIPAKSAGNGSLVLGMKGWLMEGSRALVSHGAPEEQQTWG